jgi:MFS family permease
VGLVETRAPKHDDMNRPAAAAADRLMKWRRVTREGNTGCPILGNAAPGALGSAAVGGRSERDAGTAVAADDLGTTVTGIQTAITLCTLVMAACMITGGKIGTIIGRRKAFAIGCVIYACGSFTTAIAPNSVC